MTEDSKQDALAYAKRHSRYLARLFSAQPQLEAHTLARLDHPYARDEMLAALPPMLDTMDDMAAKHALRALRQSVMGRLLCRDLSGRANLDEVVATVSDLAEVALLAAITRVTQPDAKHGLPIGAESGAVQPLLVVGMGKLGGRELNVSSDIDLIFIYPEDGETNGPRPISNHEWFARAGKRLISLIHDTTEDGFVFRVDMRLRPFGDAGPLVSSFAALENYLLTQGREWERYAWIKGRPINGNLPAARELMQLVQPFVFRKYLDYGAYASMRDLHGQIQREVVRRDMADNIKLGPGGIREVEFIAQVFQLIRGGRRSALRIRPTCLVLQELALMGQLEADAVAELTTAYVFLRNLEHRLQYLDDAQTQMLPSGDAERMLIADSMGYAGWTEFLAALDVHRGRVSRQFELVFALPLAEGDAVHPLAGVWLGIADGQHAEKRLKALGYANAAEIERRLSLVAQSGRYQSLADKSRRRLDALIPPLIEVAAQQPNPDATLIRILGFLETISRRESYLALLVEHPQTLARLASLHSASPWVADYLNQHPILLDELLDARLLYSPPDWPRLTRQLRADLDAHAGDAEVEMDLLRHFQHQQIFRVVAQDLAGQLPLTTVSDHLSDLADLVLSLAVERCWAEMKGKHRPVPAFGVVSYGKLGSKELGYGSDLDVIFIYDDEHPDAAEKYARLVRRLLTWLTTVTPAGSLYDIDMRLRPNGSAGLLVTSVVAFQQYQESEAWSWEHQALTRGRFVAGDADVGSHFEAIRRSVLCRHRDAAKLAADVVDMRDKMLITHPALPNDAKHVRGGLVDVEFIVQFLVLAHVEQYPALLRNGGNIALLGIAADAGLIPADLASGTQLAYRKLRELQHAERLSALPPTEAQFAAIDGDCAAVRALWRFVFDQEISNKVADQP